LFVGQKCQAKGRPTNAFPKGVQVLQAKTSKEVLRQRFYEGPAPQKTASEKLGSLLVCIQMRGE